MFTVVQGEGSSGAEVTSVGSGSLLDEIAREGARWMLAAALEAEAAAYVEALIAEVDEAGRRLVVRNGHAVARTVSTGSGAIEVRAPRVNDKRVDETGERERFSSAILPGVVPAVTEDHRGAAFALPSWAVFG